MHSLPQESGMWDGRSFIGSILERGLFFFMYSSGWLLWRFAELQIHLIATHPCLI